MLRRSVLLRPSFYGAGVRPFYYGSFLFCLFRCVRRNPFGPQAQRLYFEEQRNRANRRHTELAPWIRSSKTCRVSALPLSLVCPNQPKARTEMAGRKLRIREGRSRHPNDSVVGAACPPALAVERMARTRGVFQSFASTCDIISRRPHSFPKLLLTG